MDNLCKNHGHFCLQNFLLSGNHINTRRASLMKFMFLTSSNDRTLLYQSFFFTLRVVLKLVGSALRPRCGIKTPSNGRGLIVSSAVNKLNLRPFFRHFVI